MLIIGCDHHPSWQQICWMETTTGETGERKLEHVREKRRGFIGELPGHALIGRSPLGITSGLWRWREVLHDVWVMRRRFARAIHGNRSMTGATRR
jgi:transposase